MFARAITPEDRLDWLENHMRGLLRKARRDPVKRDALLEALCLEIREQAGRCGRDEAMDFIAVLDALAEAAGHGTVAAFARAVGRIDPANPEG